MDESEAVIRVAQHIADAIARRDVEAIVGALAPDFVHRTPGGESHDADAFAKAIREIPGDIVFVRIEDVRVDLSEAGALATGVQRAQVRVDGTPIDDNRAFADWFVKHGGEWRLRVAVDLPVVK